MGCAGFRAIACHSTTGFSTPETFVGLSVKMSSVLDLATDQLISFRQRCSSHGHELHPTWRIYSWINVSMLEIGVEMWSIPARAAD